MNALVQWFNSFVNFFVKLWNNIIDVLNYIYSIIKTLWYWLTSLLTWIWDLISDVFNWTLFGYVSDWLVDLSFFIWSPATVFIASVMLLVILRIWISFVFKIFRLNVNYTTMLKKNK